MIKVLNIKELPSNMNILPKLVAEIQGLLPGKLRDGEEGVDLLCLLLASQVLQGDLSLSDEGGSEVPDGLTVDEVPLLGVDLPAAGLLPQLLLRHHPRRQEKDHLLLPPQVDHVIPAPHVDVCHGSYEGVPIKGIPPNYQHQFLSLSRSSDDIPVVLTW